MMAEPIVQDFREKVCAQVQLQEEGRHRYRVFTPFTHDDGDHLSIVLKKEGAAWILSDEGNTYMRLTYDVGEGDFRKGNRAKIIENALAEFSVEDRQGELIVRCSENNFGNCLFSFVQAMLKIGDVRFLTRERVKSTFQDDLRALLAELVPEGRRSFDWHDPEQDPEGHYSVDCRINGLDRPLLVFALPSDEKTSVATITLLQLERWGITHRAVGIFQDQEQINRKVLARFTDVCDKQFSSLAGNKGRLVRYLKQEMSRS